MSQSTIAARLCRNFTEKDCTSIEGMCHDAVGRMFGDGSEPTDWWLVEMASGIAIKAKILAAILKDAKAECADAHQSIGH